MMLVNGVTRRSFMASAVSVILAPMPEITIMLGAPRAAEPRAYVQDSDGNMYLMRVLEMDDRHVLATADFNRTCSVEGFLVQRNYSWWHAPLSPTYVWCGDSLNITGVMR